MASFSGFRGKPGMTARVANRNDDNQWSWLDFIHNQELISNFSDTADPIVQQIDNLLEQNRKLAQARDFLLPRLMNGDIAV